MSSRALLRFVVAVVVLTGAVPAVSAEPYYLLRLEHRTTSDWSRFSISPADEFGLGDVLENAGHPGLNVTATSIGKPSYDATPVTVADMVLVPTSASSVQIHNDKGAIGTSTITVTNLSPAVQFSNSGTSADFVLTTSSLSVLPQVSLSDGVFGLHVLRRCRLRVETTSDWSSFEILSDAGFSPAFDQILAGKNAPGLSVNFNRINKTQFDATRVEVSYDLFFDRVPQVLLLRSTKGAIGITTFTLESGAETSVRVNSTGSLQEFAFPVELVQTAALEDFRSPLFSREVAAFYYPWYGSPSGPEGVSRHWASGYTDTPELGEYSSRAASTVNAHIGWLEQAGIDVAIGSWWGQNSYEDITLKNYVAPLLAGRRPLLSIYYEDVSTTAAMLNDFIYLHDTYGGGPNYFRVGGRPVFFIYGRVIGKFTAGDFAKVIQAFRSGGRDAFFVADTFRLDLVDVFDGLHTYNPLGLLLSTPDEIAWIYQNLWLTCRIHNKVYMATVIPGYDDSHLTPPRPSPKIYPRNGGATYESMWNQARASGSDWIGITSFNEWHEGSEIEPSVEYGESYIDWTRGYTSAFKAAGVEGRWQIYY